MIKHTHAYPQSNYDNSRSIRSATSTRRTPVQSLGYRLEQAGFNINDQVNVEVEEGKLVITTDKLG